MKMTTMTVGTAVQTTDGRTGTITAIKGRWLTIAGGTGEFKISKSQVKETPVEEVPVEEVPVKTTDEMTMICPNCGRVNTLSECRKSKVAYQCRGCGKWLYVRVPADRTHYVRGLGETAGGNDTLDIGDETADMLRGLTEVDCILTTAEFLAKNTELWSKGFTKQVKAAGTETTKEGLVSFLTKRYADRNVGMVRMNCGNLIRGILKKTKPEIR
jgi:predicted RNA-binding Zn-ribbon protein involved in translation (DUF1610 family)